MDTTLGAGIPMEGGNPTTAAQNVCPGTFGVNCSPGDYAFNSKLGVGTTTPALSLDVNGSFRTGSMRFYSTTVTLGTAVGDYAILGTFTENNTVGQIIEIDLADNTAGGTAAKKFIIARNYDDHNDTAWREVVPLYNTGPRGGDYTLDAQGIPPTLRVRRTAAGALGNSTITAVVRMYSNETFTPSSTTGAGATVASLYQQSVLTQATGNAGCRQLNQIVFLSPNGSTDGDQINKAINTLPTDPPGGIIMLQPGTYNIEKTINVNKSGVKLRGYGGKGPNAQQPVTWLKAGAGVVTIVNATAPLNQFIQDVEISNLTIDGTGVNGTIGLVLSGVQHSLFRMLHVIFVSTGIKLLSDTGKGTQFSLFEHCSIIAEADRSNPVTSKGLILGGINTSQNTFVDLSISYAGLTTDDAGLDMMNCDNNSFYRTWIGRREQPPQPKLGVGVVVEDPQIARANYFYHLQTSGQADPQQGTTGGFLVKTALPPAPTPNSKNLIFGYDRENGQEQPQSSPDTDVTKFLFWIDSKGAANGIGLSNPLPSGSGAPFNVRLAVSPVVAPVLADLTWGNQGNATAVANAGGAIWMSGQGPGGAETIRHLYKAAPAAPWSLVIGVLPGYGPNTTNRAGLAIRKSSSGEIVALFVGSELNGAAWMYLANWGNYTTFAGGGMSNSAGGFFQGVVWMKVSYDGTHYTWYVSADGQNWITLQTQDLPNLGVADQVGIAIDPIDNTRPNGGLFVHWAGI